MIKKIFLIITAFIFLFPQLICAQEEGNSSYTKIYNQLNYDMERIYEPYSNFINSTNETSNIDAVAKINSWNQLFINSSQVYSQLLSDPNQNVRTIANKALQSSQKGANACKLYVQGLSSKNEKTYLNLIQQGDSEFQESVRLYDETTTLYNDLSGAKTAVQGKNYLIFFSLVSILFSIVLFFKSRVKTTIQADLIKGQIFLNLFKSSIWMTGGLLITTVGLVYAMENGGEYYILYGPVIVGGWQMLKGLFKYNTNDKKILRELANIEKDDAIRNSYKSENISLKKITSYKKCRSCGSKQNKKSIVCTECGENII